MQKQTPPPKKKENQFSAQFIKCACTIKKMESSLLLPLRAGMILSSFFRYPHSDLVGIQLHYCLKIKIQRSHPLHTCDQF